MIDYLLIILLGQKLVRDTLQSLGVYSEKRVTKFFITLIMLGLTIADAIYSRALKPEILGLWLVSAGFDAYRITKEKQTQNRKNGTEEENNVR